MGKGKNQLTIVAVKNFCQIKIVKNMVILYVSGYGWFSRHKPLFKLNAIGGWIHILVYT